MRYFQIPSRILTDVYRRSNGFFSFEDAFHEDGHVQSHYTWFRVSIKTIGQDPTPGYTWHEMTFFSHWTPERCVFLCIGPPSSFRNLLHDTLSRMWSKLPPSEPYSLHVPIIEVVVAMQDSSVWSVRDTVRSVEKDRLRPTHGLQNFLSLHEAARHAIHSFETLSVSIETLGAIQQQILDLSGKERIGSSNAIGASYQIRVHIDCQIRMMRNLLLRAQSNKERLQNEIALAYNMIAQRDSQVMAGLGQASKLDSGAMRAIAVVTMAFLPPTFISAIFSMSFFNYAPAQGNEAARWSVSNKLWIYWAFAVPLTCITMATWFWRQKLKNVN
ncbi:hypothetical protein PSPO01_15374 [Paraphaeosphaeria sporulosa]